MSNHPINPQNNIDQIRTLIFGPQMEEYQTQFLKLKDELNQLRKETKDSLRRMEGAIEKLKESESTTSDKLKTRIDDSRNSMEKQLLEFEKKMRINLKELENQSAKRHQLADFLESFSRQLRNGSETLALENGKNE